MPSDPWGAGPDDAVVAHETTSHDPQGLLASTGETQADTSAAGIEKHVRWLLDRFYDHGCCGEYVAGRRCPACPHRRLMDVVDATRALLARAEAAEVRVAALERDTEAAAEAINETHAYKTAAAAFIASRGLLPEYDA